MTTEVVTSLEDFGALQEEWNRLAAVCQSPLLWHEWLMPCAVHLHEADLLYLVTLTEAGRLRAAAPLVKRSQGRRAALEFLGARTLGEPCGFVFEDEDGLQRLLEAICRLGLPLALDRLPAAGSIRTALSTASRGRALCLWRPAAPSLAVPLGVRPLESSARLRSDLRRARRRAATGDKEDVREAFVSPLPEEVPETVERFARVEGGGWKTRRGSSLLAKESLRQFFVDMAERMSRRLALRVGFLRIGGMDAAAVIAVEACGRAWVLKIGYDERWAKVSPGLQLLDAAIRDARDRSLVAYEFLGSAERWEERWNTERREYISAAVYPLSLRGARRLGLDVSRVVLKRLPGRCGRHQPDQR